jgi:hypothetical protein
MAEVRHDLVQPAHGTWSPRSRLPTSDLFKTAHGAISVLAIGPSRCSVSREADLVDQLFDSSEKRLARLLLLPVSFGKEEQPEPIIVRITPAARLPA